MAEILRSIEVTKEDASPAGISARARRLMKMLSLGENQTMAERQGIPGRSVPQKKDHLTSTRELMPLHDDLARKIMESFVKGGEKEGVVGQQAVELAQLHARIDAVRGRAEVDKVVEGVTYAVRPAEYRTLAQELEPHIANVDRIVTLIQYEELLQEDVLQAAARFGDEYEFLTNELGGDPLTVLAESKGILESKLQTEKTPSVIAQLKQRISTIDKLLVRIPEAQKKLYAMLTVIELPIKQHTSALLMRLFSGMQKEDTIATFLRDFIRKNPGFAKSSLQQISVRPEFKDDPALKEIMTIIPEVVTELSMEALVFGVKSETQGVPDIQPYFTNLDTQLKSIYFEGNVNDVRSALPQWMQDIRADLAKDAPTILIDVRKRSIEIAATLENNVLSPLKRKELEAEQKHYKDFLEAAKPILSGNPTVEQITVYADHLSWQIRETLKTTMTHENFDGSKKEIVTAHGLNADVIRLKTEAVLPRMMESPDGFIQNWALFRDNTNAELERVQGRMNFTTKALSLLLARRHFGPATRPYTGDGQRGKFEAYRPLSPELEASLSREWQTYAARTSDLAGEIEGLADGNPGMLDFLNMFREDGSGFGDEMKAQLGNILTSVDAWAMYITWYLPSKVGLDKLLGIADVGEQVKIKEIQLELQKMQERVKTVRNIYSAFLAEHKPVLDSMRKDMAHLQILQAGVPSENLSLTRGDPIYPPEHATTDMDGYITLILEEYRGADKKVADAEKKGSEQEKRNAEAKLNECKLKLIGANLFVLGTFREVHVPEFMIAMKDLQKDLHDSVGLAVSTTHQLDNLNGAWWKYALGFELSTAPIWWSLGNRGGLRGYPGVRYLMQNNQRGVYRVLRGVSNIPARVVNGQLRAIDLLTTGGTVGRIGDGIQTRTELSNLRTSLSEAEALVTNHVDELAKNASRITELEDEVAQLQKAGRNAAKELASKQDEIARLMARSLVLEEQLAKANAVPAAVARRTATLAQVAEFAATETGGRVMAEIVENQKAMNATQAIINEISSLQDDAARLARAADLAQAQVKLGELLRADRVLRINAAKGLLGDSVLLSDEAAELIWRAHITDGLPGKMKLLRQAMGLVHPNDAVKVSQSANLLARSGIAGNVAEAIAKAQAVASKVAPEVLSRLVQMGFTESSETLARIASSPRGLQFLDEAFTLGGKQGAARAVKYLTAIGEGAQEALTDTTLVKAVVMNTDDASRLGLAMSKLTASRTFQAAECVKYIDDLAQLRRIGPRALGGLEATALVVGPLVEAGMVGYDIYELVQAKERHAEQIKSMIGSLDKMVEQKLMTKVGKTYKGPGCEIDVTEIKDVSAAEVEAQWARTAVDATALVGTTATSIVVLSGSAGPPGVAAGLVVAGVIITAHVGISVVEGSIDQYRRTEFLKKSPTWLLAMLGPEGLVGKNTEEVVRENSGVMTSEIAPRSWTEAGLTFNPLTGPLYQSARSVQNFHNADERQADKQKIKEKSMQALAYRTFASEHPDLVGELPDHGDVQSLLMEDSEFLRPGGDYERIVRPLITLQLQSSAQPGFVGVSGLFGYVTNPDIQGIGSLSLPNPSQMDAEAIGVQRDSELLDQAGRRAMLFYVHHLREERYRQAISSIESDSRYDGDYKVYLLDQYDQFVDENKSENFVFNVHPKTLSRSGLTLAEKLVRNHTEQTQAATDVVSATEAAAMGYEFPVGSQMMPLKSFLQTYVEPKYSKETEDTLKKYSEENPDLLFSFADMEQWKTDEELRENIRPTVAKLDAMNRVMSDISAYQTDTDLKKAVESFSSDDFDLYQKCSKHNAFYNRYFDRWRRTNIYFPVSAEPNVAMLSAWKEKGYPTLIDEKKFTEIQTFVSRPVDSAFILRGDQSWLRDAEKTLPGFVYDPDRPDRVVSTYENYIRYSSSDQNASVENPLDKLSSDTSADPLFRSVSDQQRRTESSRGTMNYFRQNIDRMKREKNLRVVDGSLDGKPLSDFQKLSKSIAIEDSKMLDFMSSWVQNDGFDSLRAGLLLKRIFVISDPVAQIRSSAPSLDR